MTIAEFVEKVKAIDSPEKAMVFFDGYVCGLATLYQSTDAAHSSKYSKNVDEVALDRARQDIGWCFGEGMSRERIQMWGDAVGAEHPAGKIEDMTPEELMAAGVKLVSDRKRRDCRRPM